MDDELIKDCQDEDVTLELVALNQGRLEVERIKTKYLAKTELEKDVLFLVEHIDRLERHLDAACELI